MRGNRVKALLGVKYHIIRGALDVAGIEKRKQIYLLYGIKHLK